MAKLQGGSGLSPQDSAQPRSALDSITRLLNPREKLAFMGQTQSLVPTRNFLGGVAVVPVVMLLILVMMAVLAQSNQFLSQNIAKGSGGRGATPEGLALGIGESIKIVFQAAKAVAECTGCDI